MTAMNAPLRRGLLAACLLCPLAATAEDTDPAVQAAKNSADIATYNATAAYAQQTAQQAALQQQLATQKAQIDNLQNAIGTLDPSKVKIDKPKVVTLGAHITHELVQQLDAWFTADDSPAKILATLHPAPTLVLNSAALAPSISAYNAVLAQLNLHQDTVDAARAALTARMAGQPAGKGGPFFRIESVTGLAATTALGNLALSWAAALHPQSDLGSSSPATAQKIVQSYFINHVRTTATVIDPDAIVDACAAAMFSTVPGCDDASALANAAAKLRKSIVEDRRYLADQLGAIKDAPKKGEADPDAGKREAAAALAKALDAADADLKADFTASGGNPAPFTAARRGEYLAGLLADKNTRLLGITTLSSDADTLARDGLILGYRIYQAGTTTVTWTLTDTNGVVKGGGWKELFTDWTRDKALPRYR
jgi:hypothetical protein